jgi:hypothetical protein
MSVAEDPIIAECPLTRRFTCSGYYVRKPNTQTEERHMAGSVAVTVDAI